MNKKKSVTFIGRNGCIIFTCGSVFSQVGGSLRALGIALCFVLGLAGCAAVREGSSVPASRTEAEGTAEAGKTAEAKQSEEAGKKSEAEGETMDQGAAVKGEKLAIQVGDVDMTASFTDNSSAAALREALQNAPITIEMEDYGSFEKVGPLGMTLPRNDTQITTKPGDVILYQGDKLTIYYDTNSWSFTKVAQIEGMTQEELKAVLGDGAVTVTLSLFSFSPYQ